MEKNTENEMEYFGVILGLYYVSQRLELFRRCTIL